LTALAGVDLEPLLGGCSANFFDESSYITKLA